MLRRFSVLKLNEQYIQSVIDRLISNSKKDEATGCIEWMKGLDPDGYGQIWVSGRTCRVARISFELFIGPLDSFCALHRCDNRKCFNPAHLFAGTNQDNQDDMKAKGRSTTGDRNGARKHPEKLARGSRQGLSKLTEKDIPNIRARYKNGETLLAIANDFGVDFTNIYHIVKRKTWKHVKD